MIFFFYDYYSDPHSEVNVPKFTNEYDDTDTYINASKIKVFKEYINCILFLKNTKFKLILSKIQYMLFVRIVSMSRYSLRHKALYRLPLLTFGK